MADDRIAQQPHSDFERKQVGSFARLGEPELKKLLRMGIARGGGEMAVRCAQAVIVDACALAERPTMRSASSAEHVYEKVNEQLHGLADEFLTWALEAREHVPTKEAC